MGDLHADAAEIVPGAGENAVDFARRFFGKGGGEIGAGDLVLVQPGAKLAHHVSADGAHLVGIGALQKAQDAHDHGADHGIAGALESAAEA